MSLKDRISSVIYHEKQEPDSSLCAQHCLNSLLQDHIFEATDLADLARQLDELEAQAHGVNDIMQAPQEMEASSSSGRTKRQASPPGVGRSNLNADRSRNMDDSGFFSSQVMDEALKPFSLQLVRWRSERMRPLHAAPEQQQAFVFNFKEHWFCIRRFGHSKHFFFDLNSFHPAPKHVSPLYLGLQIDQAEHEGYSIFVVLSSDSEDGSLVNATLPGCRADDEVYAIADNARISAGMTSDSAAQDRASQAMLDDETLFTSSGHGPVLSSGFGNEDEELNRAIEASLSGYVPSKMSAPQASASESFTDEDPELAAAIAASLEGSSSGAVPEDTTMEEDEPEEENPMTAEGIRNARLARFG